MSAGELTLQPRLARHPDARAAKAPLVHPILLPYIALMFGGGIASIAAAYNAIALRRTSLAIKSLLIGAGGWFLFLVVVGNALHFGVKNVAIAMILGRVVYFAVGGVLYAAHRAHFQGNEFLHGPTLPIVQSYVGAFVIYLALPSKVLLLLLGVPK